MKPKNSLFQSFTLKEFFFPYYRKKKLFLLHFEKKNEKNYSTIPLTGSCYVFSPFFDFDLSIYKN